MFGIVAAVPTPVSNNGAPLHEDFISHCKWVLAHGCDGINILGSTGEANSINASERIKLMKLAASQLSKERLMVGTGTPSLFETIRLTKVASDLGYEIALVLPPYYYKPVTNLGLFNWYKTLHTKLGPREIKVFFYNFPQMTGVTIPIQVIEKLNKLFPHRFGGIKDSSGDLAYCRSLAKIENFRVFPSSEVSLSESYTSNFAGCISATVNQTSELCAIAWKNRASQNTDLIEKIKIIREKIAAESLVASIKFLVSERTQNRDWCHILPPLTKLTKKRKQELLIAKQLF